MSTFYYTRPSDNLLNTATISVNTGTEDPEYPATNINDLLPEKPAKLTTNDGSWVADLGSAQRVDIVGIIHPNFDAALSVFIQAHTSNAWGAPSLSQAITIPARHADLFPVNPWLDLKTLIPLDANRTFRFWRLFVSGTNSVPVSVGEWRIENTRRDFGVRNISWGSTRSWKRPAIVHETELYVRRSYDLGTTIRTIEVQMQATDSVLSDIDAWFRGARGVVTPFLIVPYYNENDIWMVSFTNSDRPFTRRLRNVNELALEFQELPRGLYP